MRWLVERSARKSCNSQLIQLLRTSFPGPEYIWTCWTSSGIKHTSLLVVTWRVLTVMRSVNSGQRDFVTTFHSVADERSSEQKQYSQSYRQPSTTLQSHLYLLNHKLNGSSSPVLTAICLSYGSLCDFLTFFPNRPGGQTPPQPIFTQNGWNDVDSRKDVPLH